MVAQTIHAAGESSSRVPAGTYAVALSVADESALEGLHERLAARGIPHTVIREGEGEFAGQAMAIGIEPTADRTAIRKEVSSLPLVR